MSSGAQNSTLLERISDNLDLNYGEILRKRVIGKKMARIDNIVRNMNDSYNLQKRDYIFFLSDNQLVTDIKDFLLKSTDNLISRNRNSNNEDWKKSQPLFKDSFDIVEQIADLINNQIINEEDIPMIEAKEDEAKKLADEEAKKLADEEAKKLADEEAKKLAEEDAIKKKKLEDEAKKLAEEEARKKKEAEDEAKKLAEEEARKKKKLEDEAKKLAEEEARKKKELEDKIKEIQGEDVNQEEKKEDIQQEQEQEQEREQEQEQEEEQNEEEQEEEQNEEEEEDKRDVEEIIKNLRPAQELRKSIYSVISDNISKLKDKQKTKFFDVVFQITGSRTVSKNASLLSYFHIIDQYSLDTSKRFLSLTLEQQITDYFSVNGEAINLYNQDQEARNLPVYKPYFRIYKITPKSKSIISAKVDITNIIPYVNYENVTESSKSQVEDVMRFSQDQYEKAMKEYREKKREGETVAEPKYDDILQSEADKRKVKVDKEVAEAIKEEARAYKQYEGVVRKNLSDIRTAYLGKSLASSYKSVHFKRKFDNKPLKPINPNEIVSKINTLSDKGLNELVKAIEEKKRFGRFVV
jgi:hypothetical protein